MIPAQADLASKPGGSKFRGKVGSNSDRSGCRRCGQRACGMSHLVAQQADQESRSPAEPPKLCSGRSTALSSPAAAGSRPAELRGLEADE
jgi:hypothetical protein